MKAARSYVNVYAINRKAATNEEVHKHLFGTKPAGELHAALADVKVTANALWRWRRGISGYSKQADAESEWRHCDDSCVLSCVHVCEGDHV